jgi:tetratricopeptide (TPR) repeat protein/transcriptional regulator with XRE-family HTH domain
MSVSLLNRGAGDAGPDGGAMDGRHGTTPSLGTQLRRARLAARITQEELAERTGLSVRAISDLERGRTRRPYPHTIRVLTDALGISDPTPGDAEGPHAGNRPDPSGGRGMPAAPRQLPAGVRHFVGRVKEQQTLRALLDEAAAGNGTVVISAVGGTAGVGKTTLAVHWAHQVADRFPDGQLYVNLRGFDPSGTVMTPREAIRRFLNALDVPAQRIPADLDAQADLYRTLLADRRMLIVLDNARDADQVRPLLPGAPGCLIILTSRNQLTPLIATEDAYPITLDLLTVDEARDLLTHRLGPHRVAAEPDAATTIIDRSARLPLALAIVAARAATHPRQPLATLAAELTDTSTRLDPLTAGDPTTDVRTAFSWSYHALTPNAAELFRLLGLHPGADITASAAASLAGIPPDRIRPLLAELTQANLLTEYVPGRYSFHDLLRTYATDLAYAHDADAQRHAATHRLLDHYLHIAHAADRLLHPARDPITLAPPQPGVAPQRLTDHEQALAWFVAEHAVLLAVVDHAAATGFDTHAWQLARTLWIFHYRHGHWHEWITTGHVAVAAAERLADLPTQAHAHRALAQAYTQLRRLDDAYPQLQRALDLFSQARDQTGLADTHYSIAYLWGQRGDQTKALDHAERALDLYRTAGHQVGQANALNAAGWLHAKLGDHQQALACCQQALPLLQQLDDRVGQAQTWDSLGYAHHHLGHPTEAIACFQRALHLFQDLDDHYDRADTLTHLGDTHHAAGNTHAAHDAWQQALTIFDNLNHPDANAVRAKLHNLDTTL